MCVFLTGVGVPRCGLRRHEADLLTEEVGRVVCAEQDLVGIEDRVDRLTHVDIRAEALGLVVNDDIFAVQLGVGGQTLDAVEHRKVVAAHFGHDIVFTGLDAGGSGGVVGNDVVIDHGRGLRLIAVPAARFALDAIGTVVLELLELDVGAGFPFDKLVRAGADVFLNFAGGGVDILNDGLGHDDGALGLRRDQLVEERDRAVKHDLDRAVVDLLEAGLADRVLRVAVVLDPAVHGGNNVVSRHFLAVVELDARAQMVEIFAAIVVDLVGLAQLRLDVELRVERDERFIDVAVGDDTHGRVGDHHRVKRSRLQIVADMQLVLVDNVFHGRCLLGLFRAGGRGLLCRGCVVLRRLRCGGGAAAGKQADAQNKNQK